MIDFGAVVVLGLAEALAVVLEEVEIMRGEGSQDGRDIEVKNAAVDVNADRRDAAEGAKLV